MNARSWGSLGTLFVAACVLCCSFSLNADPPAAPVGDGVPPIGVNEARERAKLMHSIYAATLEVMHHRFFRRDRAVLPARAMEDIFAELDRQSKIQAGWISVNTKAMSLNHEPKTDFEKRAARALASGKEDYEVVEKGYYRRATAIPLGTSCVGCHTSLFAQTPGPPRFAGLVISVPITEK